MTLLYSTFDPAALGADLALEQANTIVVTTATSDILRKVIGLYGKETLQWFCEFAAYGDGVIDDFACGIAKAGSDLADYTGGDIDSWGYYQVRIKNDDATKASVTPAELGDIIGV